MFSEDDEDNRIALGILSVMVAVLLALVIGLGIYKSRAHVAPEAPAAQTPTPAGDAASVRVDNGVVKFFFASGKAELASGTNDALAVIVQGVQSGQTAVVSGYHDATGDMTLNADLARQRALAVRDALKALGVPEDKIRLKQPDHMTGSGTDSQARRVEVALQS